MVFKKFWHLNIANTFPNSTCTFFYSFDASYGMMVFSKTFLDLRVDHQHHHKHSHRCGMDNHIDISRDIAPRYKPPADSLSQIIKIFYYAISFHLTVHQIVNN